MSRNFFTPINLNGLELQGAAIGNLSTGSINAITSGTGRIQYDSTLNVLKYRDNAGWQTISSGAGSFTLGSTSIALGSTTTTIAGLTSVTSTTFVGALTGNASTATSAATWTTTRALAGNNVNGSVDVAFANKFIVQGTTDAGLSGAQFLGALSTGIVKNTTTTGVLSIAVAGDFPTLNQNTTGSAGSVANVLTFGTGLTAGGASFNGSAAITITPVSATTLVAGIVQLSDSTSTTGSTKAATETAVKAAYDRGSTGVTNAATAQTTANAALPKAGGTMSGEIAMGNSKITGLGTPTADADAATKLYVDTVGAGINVHEAVNYATTGALGTTGNLVAGSTTTTYANGTSGLNATITLAVTGGVWTSITIDGQSLTAGQRVLIKDQASALQNGIYTVTTAPVISGTGSAVFTRAVDNDQSPEIDAGDLTYVIAGSTYAGDGWVQTVANVVVGTTGVVWTQFSGSGAVPLATISSVGIASFPTAQFSVSGAGAVTIDNLDTAKITTGQLTGARGGTGVDNTGKTITLGGNLTTSGAFATTLTTTATTSVTLPTSGTLVNTAVTTLSSLTSVGTIGTGVWQGTAVGLLYGGTGATTAAAARTNLGATTKVSLVGTGSGTTIALTHGLGTNLVTAQVYDTSTSTATLVEVDITVTSTVATATFAATTTLSNYTLVVIG